MIEQSIDNLTAAVEKLTAMIENFQYVRIGDKEIAGQKTKATPKAEEPKAEEPKAEEPKAEEPAQVEAPVEESAKEAEAVTHDQVKQFARDNILDDKAKLAKAKAIVAKFVPEGAAKQTIDFVPEDRLAGLLIHLKELAE